MTRKWITASIAAGWLAGFTGIAASQELLLGYLPSSGGPFATFSKTNLIAAEMALEEINAAGGVDGKKLKLISFDTAGKPDQAVVGLRKLAEDDKVLAIVGPFSSSECRVVFPAGGSRRRRDRCRWRPRRRSSPSPSNSRSATPPTRATCSSG